MTVRAVFQGLLDLVAPARCAACDEELLPDEDGFCSACGPLLEATSPTDSAAYLYGGPLADAIQRMKYAPRSEIAGPLGERLASHVLSLGLRVDAVVPVPLHARRLRERGFNQAALLARPVARALGVPLRVAWVDRVRDTASQASLARDRRAANVEAAFRCTTAVRGMQILLLDDVRTTGATLAACAESLRGAGATRVRTVTLARVEG